MAVSSLSLTCVSTFISNKVNTNELPRAYAVSPCNQFTCTTETTFNEEKVPQNYRAFIDNSDGYSYFYPSDWREFDFRGHDSAFKDRYMQLQNVRVRFLPTTKQDIHELGPMEEVVSNLVRHVYAAPNQVATILDMQERTVDGKNYYTFEYGLTSPNFSSVSFATIAIGNGRYYTLVVAANERRWKRFRNQLKVVADSFRMLDI
ncbi:photosynthetic NDH subunit of lumenal location 1, chloroplastic isoform X2 [Carica papaya]|uniref:photosynthetic NDH subunit of lumenal location 1, chloroplastic isoform X2 n=1 Tax=Carica papaya TaxID=3649 RepID=UPI000B8C8784|nr:photosynthetic NDH subunit of lumenal location 1, chloroplastic isoform X2 [Carica papaya]